MGFTTYLLGFYKEDSQRLISVTSLLDYIFGVSDEIDKWTLKQAILAVQRASKTQKLTQETAIEIGLGKRSSLLDKSRIRGTQVHQAIQNLHNNQPYELEQEDAAYFAAYFNFYKEHSIEPILEEFRVNNFQYGYAGRLDFYGKLDGKLVLLDFKTSNSIRWTYGLQLAMYRKCLEDAGYQVDATYVVHIKPHKRGGEAKAELFEFKYPFEAVKWAIGLFHMKLAHDPYIKWYERTDQAAIEAEKNPVSNETGFVTPQSPDALGLESNNQGIESTEFATGTPAAFLPPSVYLRQEGRQLLSTIRKSSEFVEDYNSSRSTTRPQTPIDETASRKVVIRPESMTEPERLDSDVVVRFSTGKPRILPDPSPLPSAKDISAEIELEVEHSEKDNPRKRRQSA